MFILHTALLILYTLLGVAGIILKVDVAVLVGLGLLPWEVRMIFFARRQHKPQLVKMLAIVAAIVGGGYFVMYSLWKHLIALLVLEGYTYFVVSRPRRTVTEESVEAQK